MSAAANNDPDRDAVVAGVGGVGSSFALGALARDGAAPRMMERGGFLGVERHPPNHRRGGGSHGLAPAYPPLGLLRAPVVRAAVPTHHRAVPRAGARVRSVAAVHHDDGRRPPCDRRAASAARTDGGGVSAWPGCR